MRLRAVRRQLHVVGQDDRRAGVRERAELGRWLRICGARLFSFGRWRVVRSPASPAHEEHLGFTTESANQSGTTGATRVVTLHRIEPEGSVHGERANFGGLVLGCIDSYDSESRRIFSDFSRSTRFSRFRTAPNSKFRENSSFLPKSCEFSEILQKKNVEIS